MTRHALAANENPYPPLPSVRTVLAEAAGGLNRYPDRTVTDLVDALAARHGVPRSHIVTGAGSVGVTHHLLHAVVRAGDEVLYAWPSFEAYPHLTEICRGTSVRVPLREERHDLAAMADAITPRTALAIVCNPNNPTGTAVTRAELEAFLDRVPGNVLVLLDEAYREFVRDPEVPDGIDLYRSRPNLVVLRTFSKAYGLAALRVGYAVAHEEAAARIRHTVVPFGVNALAQSAALTSLAAEDELLERVEAVVKERDRLTSALAVPVTPSEANFVWLPLGERTTAFAQACARAGVAVRAFPSEGVRVTVGTPEANDAVLRVAAQLT